MKVTLTCTECGETISETTEPIPATGNHTAGAPQETIVRSATCTEAGEKNIVVSCTVCGEPLSKVTEAISATGHVDANNDGVCDVCRQSMPGNNVTPQDASACKWCGKVHPSTFFGRLLAFIHLILYFFAHLFGIR